MPLEIIIQEVNLYNYYIVNWIDKYKNGYSKFKLRCPNNHEFITSVIYFRKNHTCLYCSKKVKPTIESVNNKFDKRNLKLLTNKYINNKTKMPYVCKIHNKEIQYINWDHFHNGGQGCKYCSYEKLSKDKMLDQDFIFNVFKSHNYTLIPYQIYTGSDSNLYFICNKHPDIIQYGDYNHLRQYSNICTCCRYEKTSGKNHYNWKGGISPLNIYLREHMLSWKYDSAKVFNYRCVITNNKKYCLVHHLYPFNLILRETLNELLFPLYDEINKYTENDLKLIINKCLEIHYKYPLGVCLTKNIHNEFHKKYGYNNFTPEDFQEFYLNKTGKQFELIYDN
jgi:hypothetical protein